MEFPILEKKTNLGNIPDVEIPILIKTKYGYQRIDFLLDTGADCTMLPKHIAEWLGIDLSKLPRDTSFGIEGGKGLTVWISKIEVKICKYELTISCLFADNESCPYLLGRKDIFSHFNILFDNSHNKIKLSKIDK